MNLSANIIFINILEFIYGELLCLTILYESMSVSDFTSERTTIY